MKKNNDTLHLVLKKKWWDMIESGEKNEEYREITKFYCVRLLNTNNGDGYEKTKASHFDDFLSLASVFGCHLKTEQEEFAWYIKGGIEKEHGNFSYRYHKYVCFHLGYTSTTMTFEIDSISIGKGNPEWGAPKEDVFIIKLGNRLN